MEPYERAIIDNLSPVNAKILRDRLNTIPSLSAEQLKAALAETGQKVYQHGPDSEDGWIENLFAMKLRERHASLESGAAAERSAKIEREPKPEDPKDIIERTMAGMRTEKSQLEEIIAKKLGLIDTTTDPDERQQIADEIHNSQTRLSTLDESLERYDEREAKIKEGEEKLEKYRKRQRRELEELAEERKPK